MSAVGAEVAAEGQKTATTLLLPIPINENQFFVLCFSVLRVTKPVCFYILHNFNCTAGSPSSGGEAGRYE